MYLWNLIELTGLRRVQDTRLAADTILATVFSRLSVTGVTNSGVSVSESSAAIKKFYLLPLDVLKNVLNMIPRKRTPSVVKKLMNLLENDMEACLSEYSDYFQLRAVLGVNGFPFDVDYLTLDVFNERA